MNDILENQAVSKKQKHPFHLSRRMKKQIISISHLFILAAVFFGIWLAMNRSSEFALQKVDVAGDFRMLNMQEILERAKAPMGKNLFQISLKEIEKNISGLPWVRSVLVRRQIPHTLWVHVKEETPKAILLSKKLYFVSGEGKIFKEVEKEAVRDLPVLTGFEATAASLRDALALIDFFEGESDFAVFGLSEIHYNAITGFSIVTLAGPTEVKLGRENLETKLKRLQKVWSEAKSRFGTPRGVDLDYEDRAFVKI